MITIHAQSRLGNQLYQYGVTLAMALKYNSQAGFPDNIYTKYFPNLKTIPDSYRVSVFYNEGHAGYQDIPFTEDMCLVGYYQAWRYWDWCRDYLLDQFNFKQDNRNYNYCSLHIRRGDYLLYPEKHPGVPKEYLDKAMWFMAEKSYDKFIVFSDDIQWCKDNINSEIYPDFQFKYSEIEDPYYDMEEMANCSAHICAASTFSLWGAELNRNKDKIVITPAAENYYGPNHQQHVSDLIRPEWHKIAWDQLSGTVKASNDITV